MSEVSIPQLLGNQYSLIPYYLEYYKKAVSVRNFRILDSYGTSRLVPNFFQGSPTPDWFMIEYGGPFCLALKRSKEFVYYGNVFEDTLVELPQDRNYKSLVKLKSYSTGKDMRYYSQNYLVYPLASIYSAATLLDTIVKKYSKNGVRVLVEGREIIIEDVILNLNDIKNLRVSIVTNLGSRKVIPITKIESIVRL